MPGPDHDLPAMGGARTTRRRGRLSAAHRVALDEHRSAWVLAGPDRWHEDGLAAAFGRRAPRLLDVGVGNGAASVAWAQDHPTWDVVAVELHRPGLARLISALASGAAPNVRIADEDVTAVLDRGLEPGTFDAVRVLFPDPWPKRRHVGRRLVDGRFVAQVAALLPTGGSLHVATDWDDYADQIREAIAAHPDLVLATGPDAVRPPRPVTIYEGRGLQAGRSISDLLATRG